MRSLFDVNVLIALLDAGHSLHERARDWFKRHANDGWASCPITQNGCIRIMSSPAYANAMPIPAVAERLSAASASELHRFWPDDASILDRGAFDVTRLHGPRQITDAFLLAIAVAHNGRFVTFDNAVPVDAVRHATPARLVVL